MLLFISSDSAIALERGTHVQGVDEGCYPLPRSPIMSSIPRDISFSLHEGDFQVCSPPPSSTTSIAQQLDAVMLQCKLQKPDFFTGQMPMMVDQLAFIMIPSSLWNPYSAYVKYYWRPGLWCDELLPQFQSEHSSFSPHLVFCACMHLMLIGMST
jgi:hypothetical protein